MILSVRLNLFLVSIWIWIRKVPPPPKKKPASDTALEEDKGRNYILNVLTNKIGEADLLSTAKYKGTKD